MRIVLLLLLKIGVEISNIHKVGTRERREILQEFIEVNKGQDIVLQGGMDFAKSLLNGALVPTL